MNEEGNNKKKFALAWQFDDDPPNIVSEAFTDEGGEIKLLFSATMGGGAIIFEANGKRFKLFPYLIEGK